MPKAKFFTKDDILRAMQNSRSNRGAARYLHCNYFTYRMYARLYVDEETGVNLFEKHKNLAGKGVPKFFKSKKQGQVNLQKIFTNEIPPEYFSPNHIKEALIRECYLKEECHSCKFKERRVLDYKIPLILAFKDRNKKNYSLENLELLCYNCFFLYVGDTMSLKRIREEEDYSFDKNDKARGDTWDLDPYQIQHLKELGLWDETDDPMSGEDLVSFK